MKIKAVIQCVPERAKQVSKIKQYIEDAGIQVEHYMDFEHLGHLWNFKRILKENVDNQYDFILFLQDDIFFKDDFKIHLDNILEYMEASGTGAVSLFCPPRKYYIDAFNNGQKYYVEKKFLWLQSIVFSKHYIKGILDFQTDKVTKHDDVYVGMYASESKNYVQIALPSLVQHDIEIKSSLGHPKKTGNVERKSNLFIDLDINHFKLKSDE